MNTQNTHPLSASRGPSVATGVAAAGAQNPVAPPVQGGWRPVDNSEAVVSPGQQQASSVREAGSQTSQPLQARACRRTEDESGFQRLFLVTFPACGRTEDESEQESGGASRTKQDGGLLEGPFPTDCLDAEERRVLAALLDAWKRTTTDNEKAEISFLILALYLNKGEAAMVEAWVAEVERLNFETGTVLRQMLDEFMARTDRSQPRPLLDILPGMRKWVPVPVDVSVTTPCVADTSTVPADTGATAGAPQVPVAVPQQGVGQPVGETLVTQGQQHNPAGREENPSAARPLQVDVAAQTDGFLFADRVFPFEEMSAQERRFLELFRDDFENTRNDIVARVEAYVKTLEAFIDSGQLDVVESVEARFERTAPEFATTLRAMLIPLLSEGGGPGGGRHR